MVQVMSVRIGARMNLHFPTFCSLSPSNVCTFISNRLYPASLSLLSQFIVTLHPTTVCRQSTHMDHFPVRTDCPPTSYHQYS